MSAMRLFERTAKKVLLGVVMPLMAMPVMAQSSGIEEIIVTAQKREQSIQDIPVAVTAFDQKGLEESGFNDIEDLATQVPNLQISALFGTSNPKIFMRGVGNNNFNQTAQSKVAVYADQVYLSAASGQLFQMFDLERVEVLRGPQGTLYGKNTTGGAISIISRKPENELGGSIKATLGNYDAVTLEGALNVPINDNLAGRLSFVSKERDGVVDDLGTNDEVNDIDQYSWRGVLSYTPSDTQEYLLNIHGGSSSSTHNNSQHRGLFNLADLLGGNFVRLSPEEVVARNGVDILGYNEPNSDPYVNVYGTPTFANVDLLGGSLTANIELESGYVVTSITGYEESERHVLQEGNGAPSTIFTIDWGPSDFSQFSQELRIASPAESRVQWIAGLFYFDEDGDVNNFYNLSDLNFALGFDAFDQGYTQETEGYAAFGQAVFAMGERLTLTLGGRYSYEERTLDHTTYIANADRSQIAPLVEADLQEDWKEWSGQIALDYRLNDDVTLYASMSRGFTAGGFNTGAFNDPVGALEIFDPEILLSYEVGAKTFFFDRKMRLNATAFFYDYSDLQVFTFNSAGLQFIENASDAEVSGLELEMTLLPMDNLEMTASLGLTSSEYQNFITTQGDLSGNKLIGSPDVQFNTVIQYTQDISLGSLVYRADVTYTGERFYDENQRFDVSSEGSDTIANLKLSYLDSDERFEVAVWAKNVTDKEVIIDVVDVNAFGYQNVWYNIPRTFGADFLYHF